MPNKKLLLVTVLLVAGAVGVSLLDKQGDRKRDVLIGTQLFDQKTAAEVDQINIHSGEQSLLLQRVDGGGWRLTSANGFPSDAAAVARLFDDLGKIKMVRLAGSEKEQFEEFGVGSGARLTLLGGGNQLFDGQFGNSRSGGGGFISIGGGYKTYLVDPWVNLSTDESVWELKTLVDIAAEEIAEISYGTGSKNGVVLKRDKAADELKVEGLASSDKEVAGAASREGGLLKNFRFSKRFGAGNEEARSALENASIVRVTLFDGRIYTVRVGSVGEKAKKYFAHIAVDASASTVSADDKKFAKILKESMNGWSYEVSTYVGARLEKDRSDFVKATVEEGSKNKG